MKHSKTSIFLSVFKNQFFKSPKQWLIYCLLIIFFTSGILFYSYINGFREAFIDRLKGLYPVAYLYSYGKRIEPFDDKFQHTQEFFHISRSLYFKYDKKSDTNEILDIGVRSANIMHFPKIIPCQPAHSNENNIWVNQFLWDMISKQNIFDGTGIFWVNDYGESIYIKINTFDLPGSKGWIFVSNELTETLQLDYNITTIYTTNAIKPDLIKSTYQESNYNVILWIDRLPFFNYIAYIFSLRIFLMFTTGFSILVFLLTLGVLQDTIDELSRLIHFAALYGVSGYYVYGFFLSFVLLYFLGIIIVSEQITYLLNEQIKGVVPMAFSLLKPSLLTYCCILLIPVIGSAVFIQTKFRKTFEG